VVINGVAESGAGFVVGRTLTDGGTTPPFRANSSLIAGKVLDTGISATLIPLVKVATFESGRSPGVTVAGQLVLVMLPRLAHER
jgi:hypothetical protein